MGGAFLADKAYSALYLNPGEGNHWLRLELEGVRSNRSAIGARIKVELKTGNGTRSLYRTVGSGGSFGCSPLRAEIGIEGGRGIASVEVLWPATGQVQRLTGLMRDRGLPRPGGRLRRGRGRATGLQDQDHGAEFPSPSRQLTGVRDSRMPSDPRPL